ncbi:MAG: alpha/beta hydrolase [Alphaproteobacteria bacterium]|jgi:pimeloyl-ACP methyl ester carboxylesterase|nr:alpha/beta hydrolase [Alphaproteobacteria bacterium]
MTIDTEPSFLTADDGTRIAYHHSAGKGPGVIFCGGFMSDMTGTKAIALEQACRASGRSYTRFDYRGHGQSAAEFEDGTIGLWAGDALAVLDKVTQGPQIIVGSSMGGWIMLLLARARADRIGGLVGIAPAPDFVLRMWDDFSDEIKATLKRDGVYRAPSEYSEEPYAITMNLIDEGRNHLVLQETLTVDYPVRILHGMADPDVPWRQSLDIVERLQGDDIVVTFSKSGDHRLSEPGDIARLVHTVEDLAQKT